MYLAESSDRRLPWALRFVADVLNGVPSIVFGIFAYTRGGDPDAPLLGARGRLRAGPDPDPDRAAHHRGDGAPGAQRAARGRPRRSACRNGRSACGSSFPPARAGIITGVMVAVARIAGETAPLLFTALGNRFWHRGLDQPIAALPLQIYAYAIAPYDDWHRQAWAGRARADHAGVPGESGRAGWPREAGPLPGEVTMGDGLYVNGLRAWFGDTLVLKGVDLTVAAERGDRDHRPVGLRQVHLHPLPQPHARDGAGGAGGGAGAAQRRGPLRPGSRSGGRAPAHRHGVPEGEPVPDHVRLRQRGRRPAARGACGGSRGCRSRWSGRSATPRSGTR